MRWKKNRKRRVSCAADEKVANDEARTTGNKGMGDGRGKAAVWARG